MKLSKVNIVFYVLKFRFNRLVKSNRISVARQKKWLKNLSNSPFYSNLIKKNQDFPEMNKTLFMDNFDSINTVGIKKKEAFEVALKSETTRNFSSAINDISIGLSSGTSGATGIFLTSRQEKELWVAAILDRVIGFSLKRRKVAFFLRANNNLYEAVQSKLLSFNFFDIIVPIEKQLTKLSELRPDILVAQPSVLLAIAENYIQQKIEPSFKKIISVAEVLDADIKAYLMTVFKVPIEQVYQCTEGFLGYTCKKGNLHLNEDWLKVEKKYLDHDKTRFHPIITDYLRVSQPIINYELNDILHEGPLCNCGSKAIVISRIEGRSDDVFKFNNNGKTIKIYPDFIRRAVLKTNAEIKDYIVTRVDEKTINVHVKSSEKDSDNDIFLEIKKELNKLFLKYGIAGVTIKNEVIEHNRQTKLRRVRNEYKETV